MKIKKWAKIKVNIVFSKYLASLIDDANKENSRKLVT
jgi:hypothetical protein